MSVVYTREQLADKEPWVEILDFEKFALDQGYPDEGIRQIIPTFPHEIVIVLSGEATVESSQGRWTLKRRDWFEVPKEGAVVSSMRSISTEYYQSSRLYTCELIRIAGDWEYVNQVGIWQFRPGRVLEPHYHDFNEYWFVHRGHITATHDDQEVQLREGSLLATRTGHEHGIADPTETLEGVGLQTAKVGLKRRGHLSREHDGAPTPL
jgi:quercetin dioxygenase-like cupin family protein